MIDKFRQRYFFLSNFSLYPFTDEFGMKWRSTEHYYQAYKAYHSSDFVKISHAKTPGEAKRFGRMVKIHPNFKNAKFEIMWNALQYKFIQNPEIRNKLIDTERKLLIEGNKHHDNIWGDCYCQDCEYIKGENHLGIQLMQLREVFQKGVL